MNADPLLLLRLAAAVALLGALLAALARFLRFRPQPWVLLACAVLPAVTLAPWLAGDRILLPTGGLGRAIPGAGTGVELDPHTRLLNDVSLLLAPWELEVRRQLAEGGLPFWSDRLEGGSSPWADPQVSVAAPTAVLARWLPAEHHFLAALVLKLQIALVGAWLAARSLGVRPGAALLAAVAFGLGGALLAWGLFSHTAVLAWAPWCWIAAQRVARRREARTLVAAAAVFALLLISGQPEVALGVCGIAAVVTVHRADAGRRTRALGRLVAAGALAFGLAAPLLVPFLVRAAESQRAHDRSIELERAAAAGRPRPGWIESPRARLLLAPFSPWSEGVPYGWDRPATPQWLFASSAYAGLVPVAGALLALVSARDRRRVALPLGLAAAAVAVGSRLPPVAWAMARLPVLSLLEPTRLLPLVPLGLALAGAVGLDRCLRTRRTALSHRSATVVLLGLAPCLAIAPERGQLAIALAVALAVLVAPRRPGPAAALLLAAALFDLGRWGRHLLPEGDPRYFYPETEDVRSIVALAGGVGGRAVGHVEVLYPALLSTYGLSDPRAHNPLASRRYLDVLDAAFGFGPDMWRYFDRFERPEHPLLDFLGVRAVVSHDHLPAIPGMPKSWLRTRPYFVARNLEALPRAFLTDRYDVVPEAELDDWIAGLKDPRRVALTPDTTRYPAAQRLRLGQVRAVATRPDGVELTVPRRGPKLLATSYPGPRGWRARGERGRLRTVTVNGAFLGVVVPAGTSRVELRYRPPGLGLGCVLAATAAASLLGLATGPAWARRLRGAGRRRGLRA